MAMCRCKGKPLIHKKLVFNIINKKGCFFTASSPLNRCANPVLHIVELGKNAGTRDYRGSYRVSLDGSGRNLIVTWSRCRP